jgi:hypothetical protein
VHVAAHEARVVFLELCGQRLTAVAGHDAFEHAANHLQDERVGQVPENGREPVECARDDRLVFAREASGAEEDPVDHQPLVFPTGGASIRPCRTLSRCMNTYPICEY